MTVQGLVVRVVTLESMACCWFLARTWWKCCRSSCIACFAAIFKHRWCVGFCAQHTGSVLVLVAVRWRWELESTCRDQQSMFMQLCCLFLNAQYIVRHLSLPKL
jgi:hypothetical protein